MDDSVLTVDGAWLIVLGATEVLPRFDGLVVNTFR